MLRTFINLSACVVFLTLAWVLYDNEDPWQTALHMIGVGFCLIIILQTTKLVSKSNTRIKKKRAFLVDGGIIVIAIAMIFPICLLREPSHIGRFIVVVSLLGTISGWRIQKEYRKGGHASREDRINRYIQNR